MIQYTGLPIPIVVVSAALSHEYYGINDRYRKNYLLLQIFIKQHRCWISEENGAIWAFVGPMLLIILVIKSTPDVYELLTLYLPR